MKKTTIAPNQIKCNILTFLFLGVGSFVLSKRRMVSKIKKGAIQKTQKILDSNVSWKNSMFPHLIIVQNIEYKS